MYNSGIGTPYWFEWEIGILECLKMLQDTSIESVVLQSTNFEVLDDVVVNYNDQSILNIQVKHTDANNNFTYSFFVSREKSLLNELASEWKKNKDKYNFKGIQIVTNKKWGTQISEGKCSMDSFISKVFPCLQSDYSYTSSDEHEQKAIEWYKETLENTLDQEEAELFTKIFSFRKESCLTDVEEKIRVQIGVILGTDNNDAIEFSLNNLFSKLKIWATSRREKQEISREDVYAALCYSEPDIPSYEIYPEKPILPSRERFADTFIKNIKSNENHIIFLEGLPGSGKTNFVSYLSQMNESIVDFRFYTYLPVNKIDGSYSDDEGFYLGRILWTSILVQLKKKFEEKNLLSVVKFPLTYRFMTVTEMRKTAIHFLPEYAKHIGRPCYFFIDGLDHAARSKDVRNSFLEQLPRPEEMGEDFFFVLVGQPVNDLYPYWMKDNNGITYIQMPVLETDDVILLLKQSGVVESNVDLENLAKVVISIIGNNVLNIIFTILELKKMDLPLSFEDIEKELDRRSLNKQIDKYYEWIIGSINKDLLLYKIEAIMAFLSNRICAHDIALICEVKTIQAEYILNSLYPIVVCDKSEYFVFHNDVRLFLQHEIINNSNIKGIADTITRRIQEDKELWKYKYDVSYNLKLNTQSIREILNLLNVEYVMDSILYGISFDRILQQFVKVVQMPIDNLVEVCIQSSAISLCLSQYANCIQYYEKEANYFEKQSISKKTESEKYCLNVDNDLEQIINDIYFASKVDFERGKKLFAEYLNEYDIEKLFEAVLDEKMFRKIGFIFRYYGSAFIEKNIDCFEQYIHFVDGWLEASLYFTSEEEMKKTFKIKKYHINALSLYISQIIEREIFTENTYKILLDILLKNSVSLENIVDLCTYGILNSYKSEEGIRYIAQHIDEVKNCNYEYEDKKIITIIKANFCLYGQIEEEIIDNCYKEILELAHITESSRGYKPAIAQYDIAKYVFKQYYSSDKKNIIKNDDIFLMMYFPDKYGTGSCYDCNGYKVIKFICNVLVKYAENNPKSDIISMICNAVVQTLKWNKTCYIADFNTLFCITNAHDDFLKVAEYWCGEDGVAWRSEYDEMESYCESIIKVLEYFGEDEFIARIDEKQKYRMFGYVGRKDYSINGLLDCYKMLPLSEEKFYNYGMRLFSVSNMANSIGDNRFSNEVDKILFDDATKLGYKYFNAFFELKNRPKDLVYWRMKAIDSLYDNIDMVVDDSELLALYNLTNAWIKPKIEQDKQFNRIEILKDYNNTVINKISSPEIKKTLISQGMYGTKTHNYDSSLKKNSESSEIIKLICQKGYSDMVEKMIIMQIERKKLGLHNVIMEAGKNISKNYLDRYVNSCVVKYILSESKYGYIYTGINQILECYYEIVSEESWKILFEDIVKKFAENDYGKIASLWGDFTVFSIYYLLKKDRERIKDLFNYLCEAHEKLSSANGRVILKKEKLVLDDNIKSLSEMVKYQLTI